MAISLRSAAVGLALVPACSGGTFKAAEQETGGQAAASGTTTVAGGGGASGTSGIELGGGAAGQAGTSDEPVNGGQAGAAEPGDGGANSAGGAGGSDGEPVCAVACADDEECTATPTGPECRCAAGFVADGDACRLPRSCDELHRYAPSLPSGAYALKPESAVSSFQAYCGMMLEGGGWTLVVNEGPSFDPTTSGVADALCYSSSCTSIGYSLVLLDSDVMIDVSNSPIAGTTYTARLIVTGVHAMSRNKTLRTLFTTGPNYVEAENNSNLAVRMRDGAECSTLPIDLVRIACESCDTAGCKVPVIVFGDGDGDVTCRVGTVPRLAIGASSDYVTAWNNCAGWPQDPNYAGSDFYPDYVRVWVR